MKLSILLSEIKSEFFSKLLKISAFLANFNIYSFLNKINFSLDTLLISSFSGIFFRFIFPNILFTSKVDLPNLFKEESLERICKFLSLIFEKINLSGSVILLFIRDIFIFFKLSTLSNFNILFVSNEFEESDSDISNCGLLKLFEEFIFFISFDLLLLLIILGVIIYLDLRFIILN